MSETSPNHILHAIRVNQNLPEFFVEGGQPNTSSIFLGPLTSLNVFIGPNNCGKSRLLRSLFDQTEARLNNPSAQYSSSLPGIIPVTKEWTEYLSTLRGLSPEVHAVIDKVYTESRHEPDSVKQAFAWARAISLNMIDAAIPVPSVDINVVRSWATHAGRAFQDRIGISRDQVVKSVLTRLSNLCALYANAVASSSALAFEPTRVYIPVLRSLRPTSLATTPAGVLQRNDTFAQRTVEDYFRSMRLKDNSISESGRTFITGQGLFNDILEAMSGPPERRKLLADFEDLLGRSFFDSKPVEIIPRVRGRGESWNNVLHIRIAGGDERPVHELGDGISHLVIMTYPLIFYRHSPLLLFIEEPEVYLHPGFQRRLIEVFLNEPCGDGGSRQVFVCTHSNCFLDTTLDHDRISVFSLSRSASPVSRDEPPFRIKSRSSDSMPVLRELGVSNSSVLLANSTIWVEGVTERMYIRRYLELAAKQGMHSFVEDIHFAFVEYAGSNITHLSLLDPEEGMNAARLCGELCLIVDKDGTGSGTDKDGAAGGTEKDRRQQTLKTLLTDERFHVLRVREIENLLAPNVLLAVVRDYEKNSTLDLGAIAQDDYRDAYLGDFIETQLQKKSVKSSRPTRVGRPYASSSGTIKDKTTFADKALTHMNTWDSLSDDAKELTRWLISHIKRNNP